MNLLSNKDAKQGRIEELVETGKKKGPLTQREVEETLTEVEISPEQ